ncbi:MULTISPECIES: hypothetical protein [unclassified Tolypothrix]|nr:MULTISPECIES: hypothetical protein [unclassified Tolypothrix]
MVTLGRTRRLAAEASTALSSRWIASFQVLRSFAIASELLRLHFGFEI